MDRKIIEEFATEYGLDPDKVEKRWKGNPVQIAEDIFQIKDIDTGKLRDLELFKPIQSKVVNAYFYSDCGTINLYKGRRIGYSFIVAVCFLIEAMSIPESVYPVVSTKEKQAQGRIKDIADLIKYAKIDIPVKKNNKGEIILWNNSKFTAYTGSPDGSRGDDSARGVLLDEMAFLEDQEAVSRAFGAFLALGSNRKMFEVSTPKVSNDLFMRNHREGSVTGYIDSEGNDVPPDHPDARNAGTLSIKQPTFHNAEDIDINTPLYQQELEPVRPDLNIGKIEDERSKDPKGFAQEYLCQPVDDSYAFFSEESIVRSMERSSPAGRIGDMTVMAVDIGISKDDTVASIVEHEGNKRYQKHLEVLTDTKLKEEAQKTIESRQVGPRSILHQMATNPDRSNPNQIAERVIRLANEFSVDYLVIDRTGPGEGFRSVIEERFGRGLIGFNFSDKKEVERMMGDMNNSLRNDKVTLVDDDRLYDELSAIQKEQREDWIKPKFTGKEYSETGKDDTAIATVLSCFPPNLSTQPATSVSGKEKSDNDLSEQVEVISPSNLDKIDPDKRKATSGANYGSVKTKRRKNTKRSYKSRHKR